MDTWKAIQDPQKYLQEWEKENNPFYPNEMKWDRVQINVFLKDYKEQLPKLKPGQNLYNVLDKTCGFIALESEMQEVIEAVKEDNNLNSDSG